MRKMVKVAHWTKAEIVHACYSACMVSAIRESIKVQNYDKGIWHSICQNYLGTAAPPSISVATPPQLRARRDEMFYRDLLPGFKRLRSLSTADISAWLRTVQTNKIIQLGEIRDMFELVKSQNQRIADNMLAGQRICVALERSAMIAEALIPVGAVIFAASAATIGAGAMGSGGLVLLGTGASFARFVAKESSEASSVDIVIWQVKTLIGLGGHAHAEKALWEREGHLEAAAEIDKEIEKEMASAGEDLAKNAKVQELLAKKANEKLLAKAAPKALGFAGLIFLAGLEVLEELKEGEKEWYAGTPQAEPVGR